MSSGNKIIERILKKKPLPNEAVIEQHKKDIVEARLIHFPLKTIWEDMKNAGEISCTYETFRRIFNKWDREEPTKQIDNSSTSDPLTNKSTRVSNEDLFGSGEKKNLSSSDEISTKESFNVRQDESIKRRAKKPLSEKFLKRTQNEPKKFEWNPRISDEELYGPKS